MLLLGFALCLTNGFADENDDFAEALRFAEEINDVGEFIIEDNFEFPTPDGGRPIYKAPLSFKECLILYSEPPTLKKCGTSQQIVRTTSSEPKSAGLP